VLGGGRPHCIHEFNLAGVWHIGVNKNYFVAYLFNMSPGIVDCVFCNCTCFTCSIFLEHVCKILVELLSFINDMKDWHQNILTIDRSSHEKCG